VILSPMTLKNGLSRVSSETPMVPFVFVSEGWDDGVLAGLSQPVSSASRKARSASEGGFHSKG
jgi:hypothetical protein